MTAIYTSTKGCEDGSPAIPSIPHRQTTNDHADTQTYRHLHTDMHACMCTHTTKTHARPGSRREYLITRSHRSAQILCTCVLLVLNVLLCRRCRCGVLFHCEGPRERSGMLFDFHCEEATEESGVLFCLHCEGARGLHGR